MDIFVFSAMLFSVLSTFASLFYEVLNCCSNTKQKEMGAELISCTLKIGCNKFEHIHQYTQNLKELHCIFREFDNIIAVECTRHCVTRTNSVVQLPTGFFHAFVWC